MQKGHAAAALPPPSKPCVCIPDVTPCFCLLLLPLLLLLLLSPLSVTFTVTVSLAALLIEKGLASEIISSNPILPQR